MELSKIDTSLIVKAVSSINEGISIADASQASYPLIYVNPAFETLTGYSAEECLEKSIRFLQEADEKDNAEELRKLNDAIAVGNFCRVRLKSYKKNGDMFWNEVSVSPITDADNKITHYISILKDITLQKEAEEKTKNTAEHDSLTNLYNRRGFFEIARKICSMAQRANKKIIFVSSDLNGLRQYNEKYSYEEGDHILQQYAELLSNSFREADVVARIGGDEFAMLGIVNEESECQILLDRLEKLAEQLTESSGLNEKFEIGYGLSYEDSPSVNTLEKLMNLADLEMYKMKSEAKEDL